MRFFICREGYNSGDDIHVVSVLGHYLATDVVMYNQVCKVIGIIVVITQYTPQLTKKKSPSSQRIEPWDMHAQPIRTECC